MHKIDNNSALRNLSALVDFSNLINSSLDLTFALNNILLTCFGKFHTTRGFISLYNDNGILEVKSSKGISSEVLQSFNEIPFDPEFEEKNISNFAFKHGFPLIQQIKSNDEKKGYLILGSRLTKKEYDEDDISFLITILNVGATAIENSLIFDKLKNANRSLDSKVNQLGALFDLGKEFSGTLEVNTVIKLLVYSLIGQMMVSKYAVVSCAGGSINILDSKYDEIKLKETLKVLDISKINRPLNRSEMVGEFQKLEEISVELVVPMQVKGETKGLILLGHRNNKKEYSRSDIEFVYSVGSFAIISLENGRLFKETLEKQRLEKDLETAKNIQNNLLPKSLPKLKNYEIAAYNSPARMVGGDYYDIIKLDENRTLIAIADVSGKGVPAALLMANIQAFLKSISKMKLPLDESTNLLNDLVAENTTMGSFITFFWGILDDQTMEFTYVNAGHNPPLLIRNSKIEKLKKGGMILGVMQTIVPYISETITLQREDAIVLFTDGITEAMNTKWEEYSDEKLESLSLENCNKSADEILKIMMRSVNEFTVGAEQSDDITSIIVKVK